MAEIFQPIELKYDLRRGGTLLDTIQHFWYYLGGKTLEFLIRISNIAILTIFILLKNFHLFYTFWQVF